MASFKLGLSGKLPINSGINCNVETQTKFKYLSGNRIEGIEANLDCKCSTTEATKLFCDELTDHNDHEIQLVEYTYSNSLLTIFNLTATDGGCDNGDVETLVFKKN